VSTKKPTRAELVNALDDCRAELVMHLMSCGENEIQQHPSLRAMQDAADRAGDLLIREKGGGA